MNKTQASELWGACIDIESHINILDALLHTMAFILDSAENDSEHVKEDINRAICFTGNYHCFSKMLFAILGGLQDHQKELQTLVDRVFDIQKAMREA